MQKNRTFTLLIIMVVSVAIIGFITQATISSKNKAVDSEAENVISGAYEALTFFGNRMTYPYQELPKSAHFAAWEHAKRMTAAVGEAENDVVDPWESIGPHNRGGRTLALAFNPQNASTLYAGSASGGLWRSYSAGMGENAWEQVKIDFPVLAVSSITFAPNDSMTMYIGTGEVYNYTAAGTGAAYRNTRGSYGIGLLKSIDGGTTWTKSIDWTYEQNKGVWAIKIAPDNANLIYAGTTDGVYKSEDAGETWDWVLDIVMANDLVIHPDDPNTVVVGCGNLGSPNHGIYKTTDGGVLWHKITAGLPEVYNGKVQLNYAPSEPNILYASIGEGFSSSDAFSWLCRSENFGTTWEIRTTTDYSKWQGWFAHDVAVHPQNPDEITVIGIEVWKSTNGGSTIDQKSTGGVGFSNPPIAGPDGNDNYVHSDCHDVIYHPTDFSTVYIASDGGIHRSLDGVETFRSANGRYQTVQFYNGFSNSVQDENFCIGGLQDNGTIRWNGDLTWTRETGGDGSWTAINPFNDDIFYTSSQNLNILRTVNDGNNFNGIAPGNVQPAAFIAPFIVAPTDGDVLYAGSAQIHKSTNGGDNWTGLQVLDGNPILSMDMSSQNSDIVYAATAPFGGQRGHVFVSLDGLTFTDVTGSLPDRYPMDVAVDPTNDAIAFVAYSGFGTGHVFRTTDHGENWEDITGNLPDVPTNAVVVDPLFPTNVYVGNDLGVFVTVDGGMTWETYQEGLPTVVMAFDLKISPAARKLRIATHGNGVYQRDLLKFISSTKTLENVVQQFDVFPNPTKEVATLQYEFVNQTIHTIRVVDGTGRVIKSVVENAKVTGLQNQQIQVNEWASGIYYVQITTAEGVLTERLVVM